MLSQGVNERGFTYIWVLLIVAVMSIGLAAIGDQWELAAERQRSIELEWVGKQYVRAIASYYHATPGQQKSYPPSLEALLQDSRFPFVRRHLRRPYVNPYSLRPDWELVRAPDGGVMGVVQQWGGPDERQVRFVYIPQAAD